MTSLKARCGVWFGTLVQRSMLWAWLLLLMCLALTVAVWHFAKTDADKEARVRFAFRTAEIISAIHGRMAAYEQILRGALGLLSASEEVTRDQWRAYVRPLRIQYSYPGIQGIGYSQWIPPAEREAYIARVRAEGFPAFTIWPEDPRDTYTSITYLEPFDARNRRAFGYDMWSHPVRRAAMEAARDTATTRISGKVTLAQEIDTDVQAGFLMYLPYYGRGGIPLTVEDRRAALVGFVYGPFRMRDLMEGILGRALPDLRLEIFDGTETSADTLIYDSESAASAEMTKGHLVLTETVTLDIYGHIWTAHLTTMPVFGSTMGGDMPVMMLASGSLLSLLVFVVLWSFASTRARAEALARDITKALDDHAKELGRSNAELEAANRQLVAANQELEAFSYTVAHDLRSPLRAIDGFTRILQEDYAPQLDPEAQRCLHVVRQNTQAMGYLIDDLLAFSRLNRQALRMRPVMPTPLVREVLEELRAVREGRCIDLKLGDLPNCRADPALLKQVFVNLLSNALKFTRGREVAAIEVGGWSEGAEHIYFVKDNGVGFEMQYADKVFGVFQRLHRVEDYEGTGVGLAMVKRIIDRHGGRIWAEAAVDAGATFYFTLPRGSPHG